MKTFANSLNRAICPIGKVVFLSSVLFIAQAHRAIAQINTNIDIGLGNNDPIQIITLVINIFLSVLSIIAVCFILYAGFLWLTAQGNEEKVKKAQAIIKGAVIGLLIILASWGLVLWILGKFASDSSEVNKTAYNGGNGSIPHGSSGFYVLATDPEAGETGASLCAVQVRMSDFVDKNSINQDTWYIHIYNGAQNGAACSTNNGCASGKCTKADGVETGQVNCIDIDGDGVEDSCNSPFPSDGSINICLNTVINFDFSEPMLVSSFNDDVAYLLASAGSKDAQTAPDWTAPVDLRGWNFGGNFDYAQARPQNVLTAFSYYSTRLYGGDSAQNFAGAITDYCGNPLDGDADGIAEGAPVDNFYGYDPAASQSEDPITWETGENAECMPVITSITPDADFYGEYAGVRDGGACTSHVECGSGSCQNGTCVGYGSTTLTINGLYLGPHPEILFEKNTVWASADFKTCFNTDHLGNVQTNTAVGDYCLE